MAPSGHVSAAIIGGGPAGAALGRLLARWGHPTVLLDKPADRSRGLAESIPPSTHKLLDQIGVLDAVNRAGFVRARGNTVWWASRERRVEPFGGDAGSMGYQVFRPDFDRVLLREAQEAGVEVRTPAHVRHVSIDGDAARIEYDLNGAPSSLTADFVLDCSGRAGIVGRRYRVAQPGHRTYALVGAWQRDKNPWGLPDDSHTVVETFADGWAWSVPTCSAERHVGVMVGQAFPPGATERTLASAYQAALGKTTELARLVDGALLQRLWACDASLYSATTYAGPHFVLVGDAGSFIDPLSSYGVKKALASAWLAAVAVHTALLHADRASIALDYFSAWERHVYASHVRRTSAFAREASARHAHPFWDARARAPVDAPGDAADADPAGDPAVQRAFESFKAAPQLNLVLADSTRFEDHPIVRGHEIVLEPALPGGMRFVGNVDLLKLAEMASQHAHVPDLFEAYCRTCPPVPLPSVVGGLSLLVARGILHERA